MNRANSIGLFTLCIIGLGLSCCGCQPQETIRSKGSDGNGRVKFKATVTEAKRDAGGNLCVRVVLCNWSDFPVLLALQPPGTLAGGFVGPGANFGTTWVELLPPGTTNPSECRAMMPRMIPAQIANQPPEKFVLVYNVEKSGNVFCCTRYTYEMSFPIAPRETLDEIARTVSQTGERVRIPLDIQLMYVENCQGIVDCDAKALGKDCLGWSMVRANICMDFTKAGDIVLVPESEPDTRPASQPAR